jgi:hypothetical protein
MGNQLTVATITHPYYGEKFNDWQKWRDVYEGGQHFIDRYLKPFSTRESGPAFTRRKEVTYNPAFAKEAVNEIKNSIFQRLTDINRVGGSQSYRKAVEGKDGGVNLLGESMTSFIGRRVLPELLTMARVGVYVDMPAVSGVTVADAIGKRPYVYMYHAEDIRSWCYDEEANSNEYSNILLRDYYNSYDGDTGLPIGIQTRYKRLWIGDDGFVHCQYYNDQGEMAYKNGDKADGADTEIILDIQRIPFVLLEISDSLLSEVANYQIALLNLASSDMAYSLFANFPFYTEQYEPRAISEHMRRPGQGSGGESADAQAGKTDEVRVGTTTGRRYPKGLERPQFIHPSAEPLKASMEKQEQLKAEIRQLVNLSVSNLQPRGQSADAKKADNDGLEAGLSYIGMELETMERKIAQFWDAYENQGEATVHYPETYEIRSPEEKQAEAASLQKVAINVPSKTYQKEVSKRIARLTVSRSVSVEQLRKIDTEIDKAKGYAVDPEVIAKDVEIGVCDLETASELRGYPEGTVKKAADDHADRLARIAESQAAANPDPNAAARGVADQDANPAGGGKQEKKESLSTEADSKVSDKQRGDGAKSEAKKESKE